MSLLRWSGDSQVAIILNAHLPRLARVGNEPSLAKLKQGEEYCVGVGVDMEGFKSGCGCGCGCEQRLKRAVKNWESLEVSSVVSSVPAAANGFSVLSSSFFHDEHWHFLK
ncbi:hypothetical protein RIF29_42170 [Crotalaria pallida]|uniref:Uncharacterized protein n=1 Tax=Crotalaria pallida TaxID=3830 RepID=A0AAN9HS61_CROPI